LKNKGFYYEMYEKQRLEEWEIKVWYFFCFRFKYLHL
jgi:hypothetical protein